MGGRDGAVVSYPPWVKGACSNALASHPLCCVWWRGGKRLTSKLGQAEDAEAKVEGGAAHADSKDRD